MKLRTVVSVLGVVAPALGQTIELGTPTDGTVLHPGQNLTSQIIQPVSTRRSQIPPSVYPLRLLVSGIPGILHPGRHCPCDGQLQQWSLSTTYGPAWRCPLRRSLDAEWTCQGWVLPELHAASSRLYEYWTCHLYLDVSLLGWGMLSSCSILLGVLNHKGCCRLDQFCSSSFATRP